jgi:hypothetical protein
MPTKEKAIYRSSNGDQWYLVEEQGSERMFVRHLRWTPIVGQPEPSPKV